MNGSSRATRRIVLAIGVALAALPLVPFGATDPATVDRCNYGEGILLVGKGVCVGVEYENPGAALPNPITPGAASCIAPFKGVNVTYWGGGYVAVCGDAGFILPSFQCSPFPVTSCVRVDLAPCGPGIDPTIRFFGGVLYFCAYTDGGVEMDVPPAEIDTRGCQGVDPKVTIGTTSVTVCVIVVP